MLAARLSEDPTAAVLLMEAGTDDRSVMVRAPAAFSRLFKTRRDWDLSTEPQRHLAGRRIYWPSGRMLGGCSSINAMMVLRGHPRDYDSWAADGCVGWGFEGHWVAQPLHFLCQIESRPRSSAFGKGNPALACIVAGKGSRAEWLKRTGWTCLEDSKRSSDD